MTQTVVVVDDHASFRRAARALLESIGMAVVDEAASGCAGLDSCDINNPDYVLLDIQLPDIDGFEVCRRLQEKRDPPAILLVSSRAAADYGPLLTSSGAVGFISKTELSRTTLQDMLATLS